MSELKLCPFCGGAPNHNTDTDGVCCRRRGCPGHWVEANTEGWNRRAPNPLLPLVKELREALDLAQMYVLGDVGDRNEDFDSLIARADKALEEHKE